MMLLRAVCLIGAAVLVTTKPPLWGLWVGFCLVAMVLLPWLAVILANDRPAKSREERRHPQPPVHPQLTLPQKIDKVIDDQP